LSLQKSCEATWSERVRKHGAREQMIRSMSDILRAGECELGCGWAVVLADVGNNDLVELGGGQRGCGLWRMYFEDSVV
jgi:hypothetical protein